MNKPTQSDAIADVDRCIERAREAMVQISDYSQAQVDDLVRAVAWAIYRDDRARDLAEIAVQDTGLGNVSDKITKNQRKTLGTLNDLLKEKTVGIISDEPDLGLTTFAKPVGVVGTMTPSTNPAATPANQAMMALKSKNAIIVSPSPAGLRTAQMLEKFIHAELTKLSAPPALFQVLPPPISFEKANYLAKAVDLILVTGDQKNVRNGYSSGTPCIGVGKGNVVVIVDKSADLIDAAEKICLSKCFDNATSCSSENSLVVLDDVYDDLLSVLEETGGMLCTATQSRQIERELFKGDGINRNFIGQNIAKLFELLKFELPKEPPKYLIVEQEGIGQDQPLSGEKLSLILTVYHAKDFDDALAKTDKILRYQGIGHSVGIHTSDRTQPYELALRIPVARVLVNQAHTFGNGGGFNNSLPFTLSMGCGTWAGNSISENLSFKDFFNVTKLVKTIDKPVPDPGSLFRGFC